MRRRSIQILLSLALLYVAFLFLCEFPFVTRQFSGAGAAAGTSAAMLRPRPLDSEEEIEAKSAPVRPFKSPYRLPEHSTAPSHRPARRRSPIVSGLVFRAGNAPGSAAAVSELHRSARDAWVAGRKLFEGMRASPPLASPAPEADRTLESCPSSITLSGAGFGDRRNVMVLPCGLTLGRGASRDDFTVHDGAPGLKTVDGEAPPRILHFNPRLKGDWSGKPVIEQNTCYRMQWGTPFRCDGWKSRADEETVDGQVKCEKWIRDDDDDEHSKESKMSWWLNRLIGRTKSVSIDWPYPFVENKLFVLTLSAGLEGYHINVDGRHVSSFPYRIGFVLEDATGLSLSGDLDIQSIIAASLPTSHPSFAPQRHLEMSDQWKAPPLPDEPVELFIGILSAANHFAERMAVRKSWMSAVRKSPNVVTRFFVALNGRKEVNLELKKEAEFFGDIVIVPFMDSYDLVVLKTVAICEYGVKVVSAKHIMKCDDDTFVRIDSVLKEVKKVPSDRSLYIGNINYYHKPLRSGKWAVTYEEWPEEDYPPYANGPGYVVSSDIANYVVSEFVSQKLRLFKMEDVSMGMWVEKFNISQPVEYIHSFKFCQFGCIDGYYTAHYQSPRQMICMWDKLQAGHAQCCNMR
uniref:Galectin domain-containing protein n=2 Tax=Ananas comosus TaxID=4615 RepID=A0A6V7NIB7_ANACO|nr:unnamed protein product [Ananas comosus var. bracteatus]